MIKSSDQEEGLAMEMKEDNICTTKCEMVEVKEENKKLKQLISNVVKDYKSLQTHFFQVLQNDEAKNLNTEELDNTSKETKEDPLLVSLSLGRTNSIDSSSESIVKEGKRGFDALMSKGLSLGLGSFEESKKQETINPETWPPSKILKTVRSSSDEQTPLKKARVSIRTRCDSQTMNDGCQWRKYGQKVAKGNPCPRAYYRCTISPTCPVRKQVQRCAEDMSILVTTYEGTHDHPLPPSATAMASTTSAAASMLKSQSSQSKLGTSVSAPLSNSSTSSALNFSSSNWNQDQFFISRSNPSMSTMNSHPTITLDLTNYNPSQYCTSKFPSSTQSFSPSCTTLNFASNSSSQHYNFNTTPWNSTAYNYGSILQHGIMGNSLRKQQDVYKPYIIQTTNITATTSTQQDSLKESIAAATKMIASNPNFQSALVAAISSYVGCRGGNVKENHGLGIDHSTLNLNLGDEAAHS